MRLDLQKLLQNVRVNRFEIASKTTAWSIVLHWKYHFPHLVGSEKASVCDCVRGSGQMRSWGSSWGSSWRCVQAVLIPGTEHGVVLSIDAQRVFKSSTLKSLQNRRVCKTLWMWIELAVEDQRFNRWESPVKKFANMLWVVKIPSEKSKMPRRARSTSEARIGVLGGKGPEEGEIDVHSPICMGQPLCSEAAATWSQGVHERSSRQHHEPTTKQRTGPWRSRVREVQLPETSSTFDIVNMMAARWSELVETVHTKASQTVQEQTESACAWRWTTDLNDTHLA